MATEWLTEAQAQEYLQVSRATLYRWQCDGRLPVYKLGRLRRYKREDLDALVEIAAPPAGRRRLPEKGRAQDAE